ncbi:hypothetical protein M4951_03640 [Blastopirellula sp. J2-11]|uniref:hypothetical protein n=1 Tax=Blastopirellula sp. J2-11 TaxID=2943192 RepID=UPI0021C860DF|nr:hypothetical protein [Blastopirellula sp. J2-11]UUO07407.1 hypothetical protein M4951_03640 [Blastopirellula sp. J2-11]
MADNSTSSDDLDARSEIARKLADRPTWMRLVRKAQIEAMKAHIREGVPYVTWRDGKVVHEMTLPPDAAEFE